jgi:hypothetical protein
MERSIDFKPSIKSEFTEMQVSDRYNIWTHDSYAKDVSVCDVIDIPEKKRIVAFTQGGEWPLLICVVKNNITVKTYTPVELSEDNIELESRGDVTEIQRVGDDRDKKYLAKGKISDFKIDILNN